MIDDFDPVPSWARDAWDKVRAAWERWSALPWWVRAAGIFALGVLAGLIL